MKLIIKSLMAAMLAPFPLSSATVSMIVEGTIEQATLAAYSQVNIGDPFRVMVSYSDGWPDLDPAGDYGVYEPDDLSIRFEIPGEGTVFETLGGYIYVHAEPNPQAAFRLTAPLPNDIWVYLNIFDEDRSIVANDALPVSYGLFSDYDGIGFGAFGPGQIGEFPGIYGGVATLVVPEPHVTTLIWAGALVLIALRCRRLKQPIPNRPS